MSKKVRSQEKQSSLKMHSQSLNPSKLSHQDLGFDRSPMAQTPKRRMIAEDQQLTFRPARNPSADVFSWHNDHHSGKTDTKWWRKPSILVPASIALLLLGFLAGRAVSGEDDSS